MVGTSCIPGQILRAIFASWSTCKLLPSQQRPQRTARPKASCQNPRSEWPVYRNAHLIKIIPKPGRDDLSLATGSLHIEFFQRRGPNPYDLRRTLAAPLKKPKWGAGMAFLYTGHPAGVFQIGAVQSQELPLRDDSCSSIRPSARSNSKLEPRLASGQPAFALNG